MGADKKKPNIIFIFIDDQGYYDLGCYGAGEIKTPWIDAMAKEGTRFTCLLYTSPSPRDRTRSRMPSSA